MATSERASPFFRLIIQHNRSAFLSLTSEKQSAYLSHYEKFEPPFEIPDSWEWVRLGEISTYGDCPNVAFSAIGDDEWVLELEDIEKDSAKLIQILTKKDRDIKGVRHKFNKGDVLYSKLRTYLNKVLVAPNNGYCSTEIIPFNTFCNISTNYLAHVLRSVYFLNYTQSCGYGVKMPRLSTNDACKGMIPLPPVEEQYRIVVTIETLFSILDIIEEKTAYLFYNIKILKSKILELAMQGKLVSQNSSHEPAAEMLKRINPNAKIITDNPHYPKLPDNWVLTDIQSVSNYGKCYSIDVDDINGNDWILELEDIEKDTGIILWKKRKGDREVNGVRHIFKSGDILYSKLRTYLNKVLIAPNSGYCSTEIIPIKCHDSVTSQYLCAWLRSPYFLAYTQSCGYGVKMPRLNTADARNGIVPLPPLNEQRRIMEQINSIFKALDSISNSVKFP